MNLIIRSLQFPQDLDILLQLTVKTFQFPNKPAWSVPENLAEILRPQVRAFKTIYPLWRFLTRSDAAQRQALGGFLAEADGHPVGVANVLRFRQSPHYEIGNVGVLPEYRRQGIARRLMIACLEHATTLGGTCAFLDVIAENTAAVTLYKNMGFQVIDRSLELSHPAPVPMPNARRLPSPYRSVAFGFGDGHYWAQLAAQLGKSDNVADYQYLPNIRRIAPFYFSLAGLHFWGRAVTNEQGIVRAVLSLLFQNGTTTATLGILDEALLPFVLRWITDVAARRAPEASLTLSIRHSALPQEVLSAHAENAGFWIDFTYLRMAYTLPYQENCVQSKKMVCAQQHHSEV
ncbi:MAG: hypothetical protein CUN55_02640 [Phototrophicales bacterium]|nr:MAG: hypothetical protein CUN55_02640 [Phototrophicales bacterium]